VQNGHGVGLSIWEEPIFSRLVSLEDLEVIEEGMVLTMKHSALVPLLLQGHTSVDRLPWV